MSGLVTLDIDRLNMRVDLSAGRVRIKQSLPYAESDAGHYTHRVRSAAIYTMLGKQHMGIRCWCGMSLLISERKKGKLVAEPSIGRPICATCEGRAIGAGTDADHKINGRIVRYAPRTP